MIGGKTSRWIEVTAGDDDGEVSTRAERADGYDNVCIVARRGEEEEGREEALSICYLPWEPDKQGTQRLQRKASLTSLTLINNSVETYGFNGLWIILLHSISMLSLPSPIILAFCDHR